ncbi:hypothetical protein VQ643_09120 [Pseudomonas sp. F1_0610]|uniref:hypothetical protein n=1 Tax=Pseudomonas sp. F1_0610 TaxID=3114284 RepID=UPI0039C47CE3
MLTLLERYVLAILSLAIFTWSYTKDKITPDSHFLVELISRFSLVAACLALVFLVFLLGYRYFKGKKIKNSVVLQTHFCKVCHGQLLPIPGNKKRCAACNRIYNA